MSQGMKDASMVSLCCDEARGSRSRIHWVGLWTMLVVAPKSFSFTSRTGSSRYSKYKTLLSWIVAWFLTLTLFVNKDRFLGLVWLQREVWCRQLPEGSPVADVVEQWESCLLLCCPRANGAFLMHSRRLRAKNHPTAGATGYQRRATPGEEKNGVWLDWLSDLTDHSTPWEQDFARGGRQRDTDCSHGKGQS